LAVVNILPFPPFDGGRLLFLAVEGIFGRRVAPKIEAWILNLGMILALLLIFIISLNDISRIISVDRLWEKIRAVF